MGVGDKIGALILLFLFTVIISLFITKLLWSWIVPDVFAGAVSNDNLPSELTMIQCLKISVPIAILELNNASKKG